MESISCHITPLVITSLGGRHTHKHTYTRTYTDKPHRIKFKKPGMHQQLPVPGLQTLSYRVQQLGHRSKIAKHFLQILPDSLVINRRACSSIPLLTNSLSKFSHHNSLTCSDASLYNDCFTFESVIFIISTTKSIHHHLTVTDIIETVLLIKHIPLI